MSESYTRYLFVVNIAIFTIIEYSGNSLRQTTRDPQNQFLLSDVLIRIYLIYVNYYSKPNNAQRLVSVEQKFILRVFVLTRFYCSMNWKVIATYRYSLV